MAIHETEGEIFRIRSRRLLLKRMEVKDITDDYVRWLNDFETTKYLEVRFTAQTWESVVAYVERNLLKYSATYHFGVFDNGGSRLVGTVTFNHVDSHHLSTSISFVIGHPGAGGKGYATEAVHAGTNFMFSDLGFLKLWGGYYADHKASERVFIKNGYKVEGRLKEKLFNYKNERVDHIYVGITADEFCSDVRYIGV